MLRKLLTLTAAVAALVVLAAGTAGACPNRHIHRVTLPAVTVVQPYCTDTDVVPGHAILPHLAHVEFVVLGSWESPDDPGMIRYALEAHTTSKAYRWRAHRSPGPGWHRFTRRDATFEYDVAELPDCAVGPGPA
jgi:hypothetical protein